MLLSSQNATSLPSPQVPASERLRARCLPSGSRRRGTPRCGGRRSSNSGRLKRCASSFSASAMPTALARPWPSGPVVVSTPGVSLASGWPAVFECSWRKCFSSLDRQVVAGQVQQRVLQHRAVAVGQHEAVAVEPLRIVRVVAQEVVPQHFGDVGHAHRHARMAGLGRLDRVDGEETDGVGEVAAAGRRHGAGLDEGIGCARRAHCRVRGGLFSPKRGAAAVAVGGFSPAIGVASRGDVIGRLRARRSAAAAASGGTPRRPWPGRR